MCDDVSTDNALVYIIEYDGIGEQRRGPFYKNGTLMLPSVLVATGNNCFDSYMAKLEFIALSNPIAFSLIDAQLLSAVPNCNANISNKSVYQNNTLSLPNVGVFDDFNNYVVYGAELPLVPSVNPIKFELSDIRGPLE